MWAWSLKLREEIWVRPARVDQTLIEAFSELDESTKSEEVSWWSDDIGVGSN
jgi:hypothetical protein